VRWLLLCGVMLMAGDARYGGFSNQDLSNYLGIPVQQVQMLQELLQGHGTQADYGLAQQFAGQSGGGPMGGTNRLDNILKGLEHLQAHPAGSHYHGFNPTDLIANVATGGLYGAGKAALSGITGKENLFDAAKGGLNQLGPWGSSTYNIPGMGPQIAQTGNLIGAGAGLGGGGLGALKPTGFGAAGEVGGSSLPFLTDAAGNAGMNVVFDPITGAAGPGAGITPAGYAAGEGGAGLAAGMVGPGGSPLGGASFGQGLAQFMGAGGVPGQALPPPGMPSGPASAQGLTPAQRASLGAQQSEAHKGLAPRWEARMKGSQEQPGLANPQDLSLAALYGLGGGQ